MECLVFIFALIALIVLISIYSHLNHIRKETKTIMSNQADFNAKIEAVNTALTNLGTKIADEAQQIRDFVAGLPDEVDTSALDGVLERLNALSESVGEIFTPETEDEPVEDPETDPETPAEEAPAEEAPAEGDGE